METQLQSKDSTAVYPVVANNVFVTEPLYLLQ